MSNSVNLSVSDAAESLSRDSVDFIQLTVNWILGNYVGFGIAVAVGTVIALVLLGLRAWGHRLIKTEGDGLFWRNLIGRVLSRTSLFFIVMASAEIVAKNAGTPLPLLRVINFLFTVSAAIQAAIWARELILGLVSHRVGDTDTGTLGSAMGLIKVLVTITVSALAIVVILDNVGVNVTALIAGLGIGGIAIGLAAQGIFSDLFAALSIIFDKPFRRGDSIQFGTFSGKVENIGLKSTRIRALSGEQIVVSNAKLLDDRIQNFAVLRHRRAVMHFGLIYQLDPDLLAKVPAEIEAIVKAQKLARFDRCHAYQFGASSIDYELVFFVESEDYGKFMQTRQEIMIGMLRRFAELGVTFAYPTQTSYTAAPDGSLVLPYPEPESGQEPALRGRSGR